MSLIRDRARRWLIGILCLCLLTTGCRRPESTATLDIHMLNVGQAECFLIKQGNHAMLVDGGEAENAEYILAYLHTQGVRSLDMIVMSHPHADHIGGLQRVVEWCDVKAVYYAAVPDELSEITPMHTRLMWAIENKGIAVYEASDGMNASLGQATVELYPVTARSQDVNDYSLITRVSFAGQQALFMGDAAETGQKALLELPRDIRATVLKIPHHGDRFSTTAQLLERVRPTVALISCEVENIYGHPHEDTVTKLRERGVDIYRTDVHGDTIVTLDEHGNHFIKTAH